MIRRATGVTLLVLMLGGCRPGDESGSSTVYPFDLQVEVGNGRMTVAWKRHGNVSISGYNIYISNRPHEMTRSGRDLPAMVKPFNAVPYPGDTNPDDGIEYFVAEGLENGKKYYVTVRVVFPDGSLSRPTAEILAVCGPRGTITLGNRFVAPPDGYSFAHDSFVRADAADNDIYFFSKGDTLDYLASPHRLGGFLRHTGLALLPYTGTLSEVADRLTANPVDELHERVDISDGVWIYGRTADGHHLLLQVLELSGTGRDRRVRLFYALSLTSDQFFF